MGIKQDLLTQQVAHLEISNYSTVETGTRVQEVLQQMCQQRTNCVFVTARARLIGIFTERDMLRKVAAVANTGDQPIDQFMTPDLVTIRPDAPIAEAFRLMDEGHYRNIPVVDAAGRIVGNLNYYALIQFLSDRFQQEVYNLPPEPEQIHKTRDGG